MRPLQDERFRWQIRRRLAKSELYVEKFRKAGLKAAHIRTVDDLIHVPVVTKQELREELMVTPEIRIENFGTLERTTFKAKRILDKRK